ncbi:bacteriophage abortive infection AbiH family protein [Bacteroidales bacterium OttesenSCG-928-B11]|nr:bacteriophage abortive infection AbiH family protein [Bacteroidales bacterium OttesenSCG-928-B11]
MNRIILIGNGFDLAHGLKTGYENFINSLWKKIIDTAEYTISQNYNSPQEYHYKNEYVDLVSLNSVDIKKLSNYEQIKNTFNVRNEPLYKSQISNLFLWIISEAMLESWYDVEQMFYESLCYCADFESNKIPSSLRGKIFKNIDKLNQNFNVIKSDLKDYLIAIQNEFRFENFDTGKRKQINNHIYSQFRLKDLENKGVEFLIKEEMQKFQKFKEAFSENPQFNSFNPTIQERYRELESMLQNKRDTDKYFTKYIKDENYAPYFFDLLPDNILFLNFNYTNTEKYYTQGDGIKKDNIETIHIHGKLDNPKDPLIFGYGDELCDKYKAIENLNDNRFLEHIKSINYLDTDNYKKMVQFMELAPYQIFIFGHSCGNSDRTLLNTLFEHENCVSIKPFFWEKSDRSTNYNNIISNISRNFNNKILMRDRVVNKEYCTPLIFENQ